MSIRPVLAALAAAMLLSGCGLWQMVSGAASSTYKAVFIKQIKVLNVDLSARAGLNPDENGRATSVVVRIYQLKDRKTFDGASYDDLLKSDQTVLAQDLLATLSTVVNPGASTSLTQPMQENTKFVAIVALYRVAGTDGAWKRVVEKDKLDADKPLKVTLVESRVELEGDVPQQKPEDKKSEDKK